MQGRVEVVTLVQKIRLPFADLKRLLKPHLKTEGPDIFVIGQDEDETKELTTAFQSIFKYWTGAPSLHRDPYNQGWLCLSALEAARTERRLKERQR